MSETAVDDVAEETQQSFSLDDGEPAEQAAEPAEQAEKPAETAEEKPAEEKKPKVEFNEAQQRVFNEQIGKKVGKIHAVEQENERLRQQLEEVQAKVPEQGRPEIPPPPDPMDPEFAAKLEARDKAIGEAAAYDADERRKSDEALAQQQAQLKQQSEDAAKVLQGFQDNAKDLGIGIDEVRQNFTKLGEYGLPNSAVAYMLEEPTGPQIGRYLAQNPAEVEGLKGLNPQQVAVKIATEIKPAAQSNMPKVETAPAPADIETGSGASEGEGGPRGAVFE